MRRMPNQRVLFIDAENRIQILPSMDDLAYAEKGQGAAFIVSTSLYSVSREACSLLL